MFETYLRQDNGQIQDQKESKLSCSQKKVPKIQVSWVGSNHQPFD